MAESFLFPGGGQHEYDAGRFRSLNYICQFAEGYQWNSEGHTTYSILMSVTFCKERKTESCPGLEIDEATGSNEEHSSRYPDR